MDKNSRVLVVDDQKDLREQLAKLLERSGGAGNAGLVEQMRSRLKGLAGKSSEDGDSAEKQVSPAYEVDTAGGGEDARRMVENALEKNRPYALMFLDMRMPPGWDGLKTATEIRKIDPDIEIVIMTAYADHDQDEIASAVGRPEKLLYIKKPFQAEEIFQLALSLCTKWSLEKKDERHRIWLEKAIRSMCRIKSPGTPQETDVYGQVLDAFLSFAGIKEGFIARYDESGGAWTVKASRDINDKTAERFLSQNQKMLYESRTPSHVEDRYVLPVRKEDFAVVVVIQKIGVQSDPEWYKLLSLLTMNATEAVAGYSSLADSEHHANIGKALSRISVTGHEIVSGMLDYVSMIRDDIELNEASSGHLRSVCDAAEKLEQIFANLSFFALNKPVEKKKCDLAEIVRETLKKSLSAAGGKPDFKWTGPEKLPFKGDRKTLSVLFANLARNSIAAHDGDDGELEIKVSAEKNKGRIELSFEDNGPGISENVRNRLFDPFTSGDDAEGIGLGLALARQIAEHHSGSISYDRNFSGGARIVISFENPQA